MYQDNILVMFPSHKICYFSNLEINLFTFVGDNCYHCQPQAGEGRTEMPSGHLVSLQRKESVKNHLPLLLSVNRIEELARILLIWFHNL